jgi:3-methyladenine DNA glycosylase AlkD
MTVKEVLAQLKSLGDDARRKHNAKVGPDGTAVAENQFGVPLGDLRALAKKIKPPPLDHDLALKLWETGNLEAQLLATLILKPKSLRGRGRLDDPLHRLRAGGRVAELLRRRPAP